MTSKWDVKNMKLPSYVAQKLAYYQTAAHEFYDIQEAIIYPGHTLEFFKRQFGVDGVGIDATNMMNAGNVGQHCYFLMTHAFVTCDPYFPLDSVFFDFYVNNVPQFLPINAATIGRLDLVDVPLLLDDTMSWHARLGFAAAAAAVEPVKIGVRVQGAYFRPAG